MVSKKSSWDSRLKLWLTFVGIPISSILAGVYTGIKYIEHQTVAPYVNNIVRTQFDTLHAPSDKRVCEVEQKIESIEYSVELIKNICKLGFSKEVFTNAKEETDAIYWKKVQ